LGYSEFQTETRDRRIRKKASFIDGLEYVAEENQKLATNSEPKRFLGARDIA
jgi:hypothetical protein